MVGYLLHINFDMSKRFIVSRTFYYRIAISLSSETAESINTRWTNISLMYLKWVEKMCISAVAAVSITALWATGCFNSCKSFQGADVGHWVCVPMPWDLPEEQIPNLSNSVFVGLREFVIRVLKTIPTITKLRRSTVSETRVSEEHMLLIEDQHCCRW